MIEVVVSHQDRVVVHVGDTFLKIELPEKKGARPQADQYATLGQFYKAIERELVWNGLVQRYRTREHVDGLPAGEGVFVACTFWLADNYALQGKVDAAHGIFERLLALQNDLGLLSEEYDPRQGRMLGNFPQAFSHVSLINTARNLTAGNKGPAGERGKK